MKFTHTLTPNGALVYALEGDLLGLNEERALLSVADEERERGARHCLVDLSAIHYMNSTGLSLLIRLLRRFKDSGGLATIVAPSRQVEKLLSITKLDTVFPVAESVEQALAPLNEA